MTALTVSDNFNFGKNMTTKLLVILNRICKKMQFVHCNRFMKYTGWFKVYTEACRNMVLDIIYQLWKFATVTVSLYKYVIMACQTQFPELTRL